MIELSQKDFNNLVKSKKTFDEVNDKICCRIDEIIRVILKTLKIKINYGRYKPNYYWYLNDAPEGSWGFIDIPQSKKANFIMFENFGTWHHTEEWENFYNLGFQDGIPFNYLTLTDSEIQQEVLRELAELEA